MFNFLKRFKKEKASNQEQQIINKSQTSGSFQKVYDKYLSLYLANPEEAKSKAAKLIAQDDYTDRNEWIEGMAICRIALDTNTVTDQIKELYRQLYTRNWNKYVAINYNDIDYADWFKANVKFNDDFIAIGHNRAYCEQADLYGSARRGYRDINKKIEYLKRGVELEDPASLGDYGYGLYVGLPEYGEANKEEGKRLVNKSKELKYNAADILLLYIDFYEVVAQNDETKEAELIEKIQEAIKNEKQDYLKPYHILADLYLRKNETEKAADALKKGIDCKIHFSQYILGMNVLNGRLPNADIDKNKAIELLEGAHEHYVLYATHFLGQYYIYANDENTSPEKAIEWLKKADLYCHNESSFELACAYLYNEKCKDIPVGLDYLERAIADGSVRALSEKAYLILETDILPTNIEEAKELLESADDKGNEYAPYRLGLAYQNGEFGEAPNYQKALEYFERGATRDHLYSIELSGHYYRLGIGGESEEAYKKGIDYLNQAIERGSNYARVELAFCYEYGTGVESDYHKAFELYKEAAANNYPYANTRMAVLLEEALLGEERLTEAFEQYKIAAEAGLPEALYNVGRYYKYAVGMPENSEEAMNHFNKAAEAGNAAGLVEIALAYETEYAGFEYDPAKMFEYMSKAAEQGYPFAMYKLGMYYYYGVIETDVAKAKEWFEKAYEAGYPYAAIMLGDFYLYNIEGNEESEYAKAFEYYQYAAERNIVSEGIGVCYEYGFGVEENETEAFKYYTLAADNNYTAAKYRLGLCYKYGRGTSINLVDAYRWLSDAANNENIYATYEAGMLLIEGEGVAKDEEQGAKMLLKAAEADYSWAQLELGNCYLTGKGVPEDEVQAMVWYQKAADNGNEQAQKITGKRERRKRR